jgi:peptidoglycan/LPS O-acetylase OafA/YrhL
MPLNMARDESKMSPASAAVEAPKDTTSSSRQFEHALRDVALDGVRGIAILMVLFVHFTPDYLMPNRPLEWLKKCAFTGWIGVDLFFVLSGMLITDVLLKSRTSERPARKFYVRRTLRIMPLYLGTLVFCFGILPLIIRPGQDAKFDTMRSGQGWYWVHCANVIVLFHGFGAMMSNTVNLAHFWSLAVEEHFYLLWPWIVWRLRENDVLKVAVGVALTALCLRLIVALTASSTEVKGVFFQTPMRMDALALGAALAIVLRRPNAARFRMVAWCTFAVAAIPLGVAFVLQKGLWSTGLFMVSIGFTIVAVMFGSFLFIVRTSKSHSLLRTVVGNRIFAFFGKYSYGMYVLHPLLTPMLDLLMPAEEMLKVMGGAVMASLSIIALKIAATIVAALASWNLVEVPFLKLKQYFEYEPTAVPLVEARTI